MRIISLINQKGGVGKTTCSINLAACLAYLGQRTILVDMDPQGHCAVGLAVPDQQIEKSVYDVLRTPHNGTPAPSLKEITWQIATNFDLAPATIALAALETELYGVPGRQDRLSDALARVQNDYDFCIIDCPPNVGLLTFNSMRASTDILIPVETGYFALHGLTKQLELLDQLSKQCHQEPRIRILATLYDIRTKLAREVLSELREQFGGALMEATINFNTKLKEAASFGQPITEYDPASRGFKDFHKLARELMGPQPRMTLNIPRVTAAAVEESFETAITRMQRTVNETQAAIEQPMLEPPLPDQPLVRIEMGIELPDPAPAPRRSHRVQELQLQADLLAKRADEVLAAAQKNMGVSLAPRGVSTRQKIEEFYGVRQLPEGLLFVAHFPNARNVAIAGDFNNWQPDRMSSDRESGNGEAEDTFRTLVSLKPGRYRYRLVVDGRWQSDPHNMYAEPNPYGELDSIVEVV